MEKCMKTIDTPFIPNISDMFLAIKKMNRYKHQIFKKLLLSVYSRNNSGVTFRLQKCLISSIQMTIYKSCENQSSINTLTSRVALGNRKYSKNS